jgi:hypothetical protein
MRVVWRKNNALGNVAGERYLSPMFTRALGTCLVALLTYVSSGQVRVLSSRDGVERTIAASFAIDNAAEQLGRLGAPIRAWPQFGTYRRPWVPSGLPPFAAGVELRGSRPGHAQSSRIVEAALGYRAAHLLAPHDATGPPSDDR